MTPATSPDASPASNPGSGTAADTGAGSAADRERGSIAVELVILTPLLIVLLLLVVGLGRIAHTHAQVEGAAADAARSASLTSSPAAAQQAGEQAARAHLGDRSCRHLDIDIDTAQLHPGGLVIAHLRCTASLAGLGLAGFPGTRTFTASVQVPIDLHRSSR